MKVSELSDQELSRLIAEKFEPPHFVDPELHQRWLDAKPQYWELGANKNGDCLQWLPKNIVSDPAMTVMLLEKLREADLLVGIALAAWDQSQKRWTKWEVEAAHGWTAYNDNLGRAVAEAFCLANGLEGVA